VPDALDAALLALVLARHPAPVHRDELRRVFAGDDWRSSARALAEDGLLHREGRLVLASRASVRANELL
jgi:hypothetical protein